ncbi:MFS transporter [Candidatus Saccharibacteria bacterium]|nr:MFS transporter [Candidatus Saccharibacteria bacterium]
MKNYLRKFFVGIKVNRIIEFLTLSDILVLSGWGLVTPIIAVFFTEQVEGGSVALAGLASAVYFLVKSFVQIPIARYIDLKRGEWDDYWIMIAGSLLITTSAFLYILVKYPWQVMVVQAIYGIGGALSYPSWLAIFTRHVDRHEEGLEWSLYYTATDLGSALAGAIGGLMAATFGYNLVFAVAGVMSLGGTLFLAGVGRRIKKRAW